MAHRPHFGLVALLLYFLLHAAQHYGIGGSFLICYGKDLVCLPLILTATDILAEELKISKPKPQICTLLAFVYVSVIFEGILPRMSTTYISDINDIACYAVGGTIYALLNRSYAKNISFR